MRARRVGWAGHGDLAASIALVFPLMLAYGVAAAITMQIHVADLPSRALWWACDRQRQRYLVAYAAIALGFLAWLRRHRRAEALRLAVVAPVVGEAAIYAFTLATVVWAVVARLPGLGADAVVGALGAGVHEELLFRLVGVAGGAALGRRLGLSPRAALIAAVAVSSLGFAAAQASTTTSAVGADRAITVRPPRVQELTLGSITAAATASPMASAPVQAL